MSEPAILLVEDDPDSVFFLEHLVGKLGITNPLHVAQDGREAMDYLEGVGRFSNRDKYPLPDLMILDLKLPRMSGFEVLQAVRQRPETRTLIVMILTASASDQDVEHAYALGANAYLVKPLRLEELEKIVSAIRAFWLTHNHSPPRSAIPSAAKSR